MKTTRHIVWILAIMTCSWNDGVCQKKMDSGADSTIIRNLPEIRNEPFIDFKNINLIPFYEDKKDLRKIDQYRTSGDHEAWYTGVKNYVSH
jgi:hypothetical protein